ncbi:MAG: AAA family ATPase [Thermosynechococcaceae cyanobacterium]
MKPEQDETTLSLLKAYEQSDYLAFEKLGSPGSSNKKGLKTGLFWRFLRRNLFLILGTTLGVTGLVFYLLWRQPLKYEGEFQLLVEPVTADGPSVLPRGEDLQEAEGVDYATLTQLLTSPTVLNKMIGTIQSRYSDINYNNLSRDLAVERSGQGPQDKKTKLIRVSYQDEDVKKILAVLDELARGYIQYSEEKRQTYIGEGVSLIAKRLPESRQNVSTLEEQLQQLQQKYRITDPNTEGAELAKQARELEAQRLEVQRDLQAQKSLYASLQKQLGLAPGEAIAASSLTENPRYQKLLGDLKAIETEIASEAATLTDANPRMQDLRAKQRNLKTLLAQETRKLAGQNLTGGGNPSNVPTFQGSLQQSLSQQLVAALNEIQVLEVRNQATQQAAVAVDKKLQQFPSIMRRHNEIQRKLNVATETLNQLLKSQETLKVEDAQQQIPWQLVWPPKILSDPNGNPIASSQGRTKKLALGVLGGLLLGLGAALLREKRQDVFHSNDDLQDETELPLLGTLPYSDSASVLESHRPLDDQYGDMLSLSMQPQPAFSQATEALYAKLRFLHPERPMRALVISSIMARDGKTTAAMHLAQVAANTGQRVLLVDANMTMPQLHRYLGVPNFEGLSEILHKKLDPNQYIQRSPYQANLFILASGQSLIGASQLLASTQMQYLMEQFQNMFDLVIYDTAHLQNHADAKFLSLHADGMVLVVGIGRTQQSCVLRSLKSLNASHLNILGTVANFAHETMDFAPEQERRSHHKNESDDEFEIFRV